jgi:hypothetical protein
MGPADPRRGGHGPDALHPGAHALPGQARSGPPEPHKKPRGPSALPGQLAPHLQRAIPAANTRPVPVFRQDDSRYGLFTIRRRRLTARGVQPVGRGPQVFEWCYVDGGVEPTTGDRFFLELPALHAARFHRFVDLVAPAGPERLHLRLRDHRGAHPAPRLTLPEHGRRVGLPLYGPGLRPMARVWRALQDALAWLQFATRDGQHDQVAARLWAYHAATRHALTSSPSLLEAIHALSL